MSAVTHTPKCYVFVCMGCGLLACSRRSDALTCSTQCRVKAHRNGSLQALRELAESIDVRPAMIRQALAVTTLRPDLEERITAGRMTIAEAQAHAWPAFLKLAGVSAKPFANSSANPLETPFSP